MAKHNGQEQAAPAIDAIAYDDAVREGKEIVAQIEDAERGQLRLGELADKLEPKHGDRTLAKFATEIGRSGCTLERYRSVWRKWKSIPAARPVSYAVLRALQDHLDRANIVREQPKLTEREATKLMRTFANNKDARDKEAQEDHWLKHNRKWFQDLVTLANDATRAAGVLDQCTPGQLADLTKVVDPELLNFVWRGGKALVNLAGELERLLEDAEQKDQEDAEASAPIERPHPEAMAQTTA